MTRTILEVDRLALVYTGRGRDVNAIQDASLLVKEGEAIGVAGESGSGKSTLARAVMGLLPPTTSRIVGGRIVVEGVDATGFGPSDWQSLRGSSVAMVFQDPLSFLNPVVRVGRQIAEGIALQDPHADRKARTRELLELVKLRPSVIDAYPHELSGGMRQRVMLAIALGCRPRLLVADEPTTALDVTTQGEILALLDELRRTLGMALVLISHDLGVLRRLCDRIYVMYAGHTIETGRTAQVLGAPAHPYTRGLIAASRLTRGPDGRFSTIGGDVPSLQQRITACPFQPRCGSAMPVCAEMPPFLDTAEPDHLGRCWLLTPEPGGAPALPPDTRASEARNVGA
ncbi:ABC transporter ATP-binding protein [Ancylobacter sp. MQZ15Z-1]|uniref:ABC transporter ATP-binding protein n=1 Tax=Ancylobacter mangrovi TaxID=2972472 RepID=A0A9X2PDS5_9HYPH|nr:ABC transporter ATP-binding protein [Ancylobacter mangrovi]MCS0495529.1 ABC transporter ATP-binding protein [Ancylobacter mangrovi]